MTVLEANNLYGILSPIPRKGGFKIQMNDERITSSIKACILKCSETYISTYEKKSVRVRYLNTEKLDKDMIQKISEKVTEARNSFQIWMGRAVDMIDSDYQCIYNNLTESLTESGLTRSRHNFYYNWIIILLHISVLLGKSLQRN